MFKPPSRLLSLEIAATNVHLTCADPELLEALRRRYQPFRASGKPRFELQLVPAPHPHLSAEPATTLSSERRGDTWRFRWQSSMAEFDFRRQRGVAEGALSPYTVDSWLRVLLSFLLPFRQGLLLHAATVLRSDRAYVFLGKSGAGKSTLARLVPPGQVLTDEVSLIRLVRGSPRAYGSPFWGEFVAAGQNREVRLAGLYLLIQDQRSFPEPALTGTGALGALSSHILSFAGEPSRAVPPNASGSPLEPERGARAAPHSGRAVIEAQLQVAAQILERVPLYPFHFRPDKDFWKALPPAARPPSGSLAARRRRSR